MLPKYDEVARLFSYSGILTPEYFKYLNENVIPFYTKWLSVKELLYLSDYDVFDECSPTMYSDDMHRLLDILSRGYDVEDIDSGEKFIEFIDERINDVTFQKIICYDSIFADPSRARDFDISESPLFVFYFLNKLNEIKTPVRDINLIIQTMFQNIEIDLTWFSLLKISQKPVVNFVNPFGEFMDDVEKMKGFTILDMITGLKMIKEDVSGRFWGSDYYHGFCLFIAWLYFSIESKMVDDNIDNRFDILRKLISY